MEDEAKRLLCDFFVGFILLSITYFLLLSPLILFYAIN